VTKLAVLAACSIDLVIWESDGRLRDSLKPWSTGEDAGYGDLHASSHARLDSGHLGEKFHIERYAKPSPVKLLTCNDTRETSSFAYAS
jgi:hypothetical protein